MFGLNAPRGFGLPDNPKMAAAFTAAAVGVSHLKFHHRSVFKYFLCDVSGEFQKQLKETDAASVPFVAHV